MHSDMLAPVPTDGVAVEVFSEVVLLLEPEQPVRARAGATKRVMRAEILLGIVLGVLTRFSLRSCRRFR
ncbi:hypothetical protein HMPREF9576_00112 [Cutibacterium acnes HL110PA2]|nr:hypothetical protein HMPREF9576_00112 [Cutibacterium acnes HL110PA2]